MSDTKGSGNKGRDHLPVELPTERVLSFPLSNALQTAWDSATCRLTTKPPSLALQRPHLEKLGATSIGELFSMALGSRVLVTGVVISWSRVSSSRANGHRPPRAIDRQGPSTAKGFCFLILEDETGRLLTALAPQNYEKFERILREPALLVEGRLEAPPKKRGPRKWAFIARFGLNASGRGWLTGARPVHGAQGHAGENPRVAIAAG